MLSRLGVLRACGDDVDGVEAKKERGLQAAVLCFCGRYGHLGSGDGARWMTVEGEWSLVGAVEGMLDAHGASQKAQRRYGSHCNMLQHGIVSSGQIHEVCRCMATCSCDQCVS